MEPLQARVKNRRLLLDEPTDRPEGTIVDHVPLDDVLDEDERQALLRELGASITETEPGELIDADDVLSELRTTG